MTLVEGKEWEGEMRTTVVQGGKGRRYEYDIFCGTGEKRGRNQGSNGRGEERRKSRVFVETEKRENLGNS